MKVMNPEWERFTNRPVDITYRDKIGEQIEMDQMDCISEVIDEMIRDKDKYSEALEKLLYETIYNVGNSAEVGARYIISVVQRQIEAKRIGRIDG
jgi:YidC/Oxa1 family membrane protein insertase